MGIRGMAAAPPMSTLGLCMDDDVMRVAVGVSLCQSTPVTSVGRMYTTLGYMASAAG